MTKNTKLKAALFEKGVTQAKLSKETNIPRAYISLAINGKFNLDDGQRQKVAAALGYREHELFPAHGCHTI
jgi:transcriptional regulator with XRE-family HTH domain